VSKSKIITKKHCVIGCPARDEPSFCEVQEIYGHCSWIGGLTGNCQETSTLNRCDRVNHVYGDQVKLEAFNKLRTGYDAFRSQIFAFGDNNLEEDPGLTGKYIFDCFSYDQQGDYYNLGKRGTFTVPDQYSVNQNPLQSTSISSSSTKSSTTVKSKISASIKLKAKGWGTNIDVSASCQAQLAKRSQKDEFVSTSEAYVSKFELRHIGGDEYLPLSEGFSEHLNRISGTDINKFYGLFQYWGTHAIMAANFGARFSESTIIEKSNMNNVSKVKFKAALEVGSGAMGVKVNGKIDAAVEKEAKETMAAMDSKFRLVEFGDSRAFKEGDNWDPNQLAVIKMDLNPICKFITNETNQITCYNALKGNGYCEYLVDKGLVKKESCHPIKLQCISDFDCPSENKCVVTTSSDEIKSTCESFSFYDGLPQDLQNCHNVPRELCYQAAMDLFADRENKARQTYVDPIYNEALGSCGCTYLIINLVHFNINIVGWNDPATSNCKTDDRPDKWRGTQYDYFKVCRG